MQVFPVSRKGDGLEMKPVRKLSSPMKYLFPTSSYLDHLKITCLHFTYPKYCLYTSKMKIMASLMQEYFFCKTCSLPFLQEIHFLRKVFLRGEKKRCKTKKLDLQRQMGNLIGSEPKWSEKQSIFLASYSYQLMYLVKVIQPCVGIQSYFGAM